MCSEQKKSIALVTGASGFVAGPLIQHLLATGRYSVRGTVRSLDNTSKVAHLKKLFANIELFEADLLKKGSFDAAVQGCDVVFHTASPFQINVDDPQKDLVDPAINGTLNVLSAVDKSDSVKRVVVTSSVAAIARGKPEAYEYTEKDWNLESTLESGAYPYSKRMAEEAAWKVAKDKKWKLSVICPSFVLGPPASDRTDSVSVQVIKNILEGNRSETEPGMAFGCVHVDDIAKAHIQAAERPSAAGERFMVTSSSGFSKGDLCQMLKDSLQFESFPLDNNVCLPPSHRFRYNNAKVCKELGLELIPVKDAVINMAKALIKLGIVTSPSNNSEEEKKNTTPLKRKAIEGDEPEGATKKLKSINPEPDVTSDKSESKEGYHDLPAQPLDEQWTSSKENLSETHLKIEGHPVMEKWETPYMGALAKKATENGGKVMEIGFGMGISATAVQQCSTLAEHVIIELNGDVYKRLLEFKQKYPKVTPMLGGWESQLEKIEDSCMDGILYDTYPLSKATQHVHQFAFVKDAKKKLRVGGILTYCNLTSLGVLRKKSEYNNTDLSDKENWSNLFRETQLPHLTAAGWDEDEISWDIFELPKKAIEDRDKVGCDYYTHNSCLVPHLERKR